MMPMQRRTFKRLQHIAKKFGIELVATASTATADYYVHISNSGIITWIERDGRLNGRINNENDFRRRCREVERTHALHLAEILG